MIFSRKSWKPAPPVHRLGGAAKQITANLLMLTDGTVLAGYRVGPRRWGYTPEAAKERTIQASAEVFGALSGRLYHERVTARPHPVAQWAANLDARTPHPLPGVGAEDWNAHLMRMQTRIAAAGMDDKLVFRYFGVGQVSPRTDLRAALAQAAASGEPPREEAVRAVLASERTVADTVAIWPARRMSESEQAWLRTRSLAPGILPGVRALEGAGFDEHSLPSLGDHVRWSTDPFGQTVSVTALVEGRQVERAVQVLSVARMADLRYPESGLEPWQTYAERAVDASGHTFAVDWSIVGELRTADQLKAGAELDLRKAIWLERDYRSHSEPPPAGIERGIAVAKSTRDQVHEGRDVESGRFVGTINAVVVGEPLFVNGRQVASAAEVCTDRAAALARLLKGNDLRMEVAPAQPQYLKLAETIPGQPRESTGYQCQVRYDYLASGLSNATEVVGDMVGPYLGATRTAIPRPVMHDPHYATEGRGVIGRGNNMHLITGELGAGKSMLAGSIGYNAARRAAPGERVIISDPSGPMAALAALPELAPYSQVIDLLKGKRGVLSPPALVREPLPGDFDEPGQWAEAVALAKGERRKLSTDIARRCLDSDLYDAPETLAVLREAARSVQWDVTATLWDLIAALLALGGRHALAVAAALVDASGTPVLNLLFPRQSEDGQIEPVGDVYDARLTIITTPGIRRAADGTPRSDWNDAELAADVVLRLVSLFTDRLIYNKSRHARCVVIFDEAENLTDFGPGRGFLSRLGRDHSKWNVAVYLLVKSINPQMLSGELRNFLAGAFVGRMANIETAESMLNILRVGDRRHAASLMRLSEVVPGEFVHLDADGNVGAIRVDLDYHPPLKNALMTNPATAGADAWSREEML
jgi:hypothetical protein